MVKATASVVIVRQASGKTLEILNLQSRVRRIQIGRVRQVMRADENIRNRHRHIARQLPLERQIRLRCRSVFEVFRDRQRERQNRAETGKRLIVKTLSAELILRRRSHARRANVAANAGFEPMTPQTVP